MQPSELLNLLAVFTQEEWDNCEFFLKQRERKNSLKIILFRHLKKNKTKIREENFWKKTHKSLAKTIQLDSFNNRGYRLKDLIVEYILDSEIKKNKLYQLSLLSNFFKQKGLNAQFHSMLKEIKISIEELKEFDVFSQLNQLIYNHHFFFSELLSNQDKLDALGKALSLLNIWHRNLKLFYETEIANQKELYHNNINAPDIYSEESSLFLVIKHLDDLVQKKSEESFLFLENILRCKFSDFSNELAIIVLLRLINFASYKVKIGSLSYRDKILGLYDFGLENNLLHINGKISEYCFLNLIDARSKYGQTEDIPNFIEKWLVKTESNELETVADIAWAIYYFSLEKYDKVNQIISTLTKVRGLNLSVREKCLAICSICSEYDNSSFIIFDSLIDNARRFVNRNKEIMPVETKKGILNMLTIAKKIWHKEPPHSIEIFMDNCDYLVNRKWVEKELEKMTR